MPNNSINKDPIHFFYFTEDRGKVVYDRCFLNADSYIQKITIHKMQSYLGRFNLKEEIFFTDLYIYHGETIKITVNLRDKDGFWDDERRDEKTEEDYRARVEHIDFHALKPISNQELEIIEGIMKNFDLNIYYPNKEKRFTDVKELKKFFV